MYMLLFSMDKFNVLLLLICLSLQGSTQSIIMSKLGVQSDPFVIKTNELPPYKDFFPTIANGYVGHKLHNDTIYKTGFYNGKYGNAHRARIRSTIPYINIDAIEVIDLSNHILGINIIPEYTLNMREGSYSEKFTLSCNKTSTIIGFITQTIFAHNKLKVAVATEIHIDVSTDATLVFKIPLKDSKGNVSKDTSIVEYKNINIQSPCCDKYIKNVTYEHYVTNIPETNTSTRSDIYIVSTFIPNEVLLSGQRHKTFGFISSFGESREKAFKAYETAMVLFEGNLLYSSHSEIWNQVWNRGHIIIDSRNEDLGHSTVSALYYLLSALPPDGYDKSDYDFYGISPGGLTNGGENQDYWGHVFWDQDFWMLPALLPLFPEKVKLALIYRVKNLNAAMRKAQEFGYDGAFYPWESAYTGEDVCPGEVYIKYEQHVTGDIVHMIKQYLFASDDWQFLNEFYEGKTAWDVVYETAKFWKSRVYQTVNNKFGIKDVMGPDEYHDMVTNSAFTNAVAASNLKFAVEIATKLGKTIPEHEEFLSIAHNMYIPYDEEYGYHPEFDGFNWTKDTVKQADTIMLNFPLNYLQDQNEIVKDLDIYENITDPFGPAMTSSMFAINWLSVSQTDKADKSFVKQFENIQKPFQIWSEIADGTGAVNFLTGIGGYIQSILYGYVGLRIHKSTMAIKPVLMPDDDDRVGYKVGGLKYKQNQFNLVVSDTCSITLTKLHSKYQAIKATFPDGSTRTLTQSDPLYFNIKKKLIIEPILK